MNNSSLISFIKSYYGNNMIKVNLFLKDGTILDLNALQFANEQFKTSDGKSISGHSINYAEITSN